MEVILPFLIVAIVLIPSVLQNRQQQRRKQHAQPTTPSIAPQSPATAVEPSIEPTQAEATAVPSRPIPTTRRAATSAQSVATQSVDAPKTSATSEPIRPEVMRHFDLKQAILYSEIMTPKF